MLIPLPTLFASFISGSRPLDLLTDRLKCLPSSVAVLITCPTSELPTVPRELASLVHFEFVVDDLSEADRCEFARFAFGKRNGVVVDAKWFASNTRVSRSQWRSQECRSGGGVQGTLDPQNIVLAPLFMKAAAKYGKGTSHRGIKGRVVKGKSRPSGSLPRPFCGMPSPGIPPRLWAWSFITRSLHKERPLFFQGFSLEELNQLVEDAELHALERVRPSFSLLP